MSVNDKIVERIKNLLELAEDGNNDEESQTALLLAQKLMLKHKISQDELSETGKNEIVLKSLSVYKRLFWYEKILVKIIAENFRVMFYVQSNKFPHQKTVQSKLVLMGYPEDVELAYKMYYLAEDAMKYFASAHIDSIEVDPTTPPQHILRRVYYRGFMDGLEEKFKLQREALKKEDDRYALMVQVPEEVQKEYEEQITGSISFEEPEATQDEQAYQAGFEKGSHVELGSKGIEE